MRKPTILNITYGVILSELICPIKMESEMLLSSATLACCQTLNERNSSTLRKHTGLFAMYMLSQLTEYEAN
jgi:hypothetical protein